MLSNYLILCCPLLLLPSVFLASASVIPMNIQDWFSLELAGLISLQSKGLSKLFSGYMHIYMYIYIYPLLTGPPTLPHPSRSPQSTKLSSLCKHHCPVHIWSFQMPNWQTMLEGYLVYMIYIAFTVCETFSPILSHTGIITAVFNRRWVKIHSHLNKLRHVGFISSKDRSQNINPEFPF